MSTIRKYLQSELNSLISKIREKRDGEQPSTAHKAVMQNQAQLDTALENLKRQQEFVETLKSALEKSKRNAVTAFFGVTALYKSRHRLHLVVRLLKTINVSHCAANYATHVAKEAEQAYDALKKRKSASDERLPFKKRRITSTTTTNVVDLTQCD